MILFGEVANLPCSLTCCFVLFHGFFAHQRFLKHPQVGQNLVGSLTTETLLLPKLRSLELPLNSLTGGLPLFPPSVDGGGLTSLEVQYNGLSGTLSPDFFESASTSLRRLNIGGNMFEGRLPYGIGLATTLTTLNIFDNDFTGTLPSDVSDIPLVEFRAQYNLFEGPLPPDDTFLIRSWSTLEYLWLQDNPLFATFPRTIGNFRSLKELRISNSNMLGDIPASMFDLRRLEVLDLEGNLLSGTIHSGIAQLTSLQEFRVSSNQLFGTIPEEMAIRGDNLRVVDLQFNQFSGSVPETMCFSLMPGFVLQADCWPTESPPNPCSCCTSCCDRESKICYDTDEPETPRPSQEVYQNYFSETFGDRVFEDGSSFQLAARWIYYSDELKLGIESDTLLQRYILVVFYFATTNYGRSQWTACSPSISGDPNCVFDDSVGLTRRAFRWMSNVSECFWMGVECADTTRRFVTKMELRK